MGNKPSYHLDADDYVHVIQTTGSPIQGRFDGVDYLFEDGVPSEPVHWKVAHHIFGYRGTEQARLNAIHRLGWLNRMETAVALDMLRKCVRYEPLELLPKGVLEFKPRGPAGEQSEAESSPVTPTAGEAKPAGSGARGTSAPVAPPDPLRKAKQG